MGHSQADKARTHERIVQIASQRLREAGLEGVGVADLMKDAGLTVGGFYKHFASRDELVAEAVEAAFRGWEGQNEQAAAEGHPLTYERLVDDYLSTDHRDHPGQGCAFSALACDLARSGAKTRALASDQFQRNLALISGLLRDGDKDAGDDAQARAMAILVTSAMTGAIALARVLDDEAQSREVLEAVRTQLQALHRDVQP
jgi:TetR/AcrR family transcriptional repressor of nem operon